MKIFSAKIAQNDREIDAKIFDLYDLTEEEREWILSF
jgi:hypothetical protein